MSGATRKPDDGQDARPAARLRRGGSSRERAVPSPRELPFPDRRSILWTPDSPRGVPPPEVPDDPLVLTQAVLRVLWDELVRHRRKRRFGFLAGDLFQCPKSGRRFALTDTVLLTQEAFVEETAEASLVRAWSRVQESFLRRAGLLLGWYHSAPGGVALGERAEAAFRRYFREPWQVAMVVVPDPAQPRCAVYRKSSPEDAGCTAVPFYELLEEAPSAAAKLPSAAVRWANHRPGVPADAGKRVGVHGANGVRPAVAAAPGPREVQLPDASAGDASARPPSPVSNGTEVTSEAAQGLAAQTEVAPAGPGVAPEEAEVAPAEVEVAADSEVAAEAEVTPAEAEVDAGSEVAAGEAEVAPAEAERRVLPGEDGTSTASTRAPPGPAVETGSERGELDAGADVRGPRGPGHRQRPSPGAEEARSEYTRPSPPTRIPLVMTVRPEDVRRGRGWLGVRRPWVGGLAALLAGVVVGIAAWQMWAPSPTPELSTGPGAEGAAAPTQLSPLAGLNTDLELALDAYMERRADFRAGLIPCDLLAAGYAEADAAFVRAAAVFGRLQGAVGPDAEEVARFQRLAARMDTVNLHFDSAGCSRPS